MTKFGGFTGPIENLVQLEAGKQKDKITDNLSCPFCRSSVTHRFFEPDGLGDYEPQHNFVCDGCEALVVLTDMSLEEAITVYNKRPNETHPLCLQRTDTVSFDQRSDNEEI